MEAGITDIRSSQCVVDLLATMPCHGVFWKTWRVLPHLSSSTYLLSTSV